jgi:hypothetical protein
MRLPRVDCENALRDFRSSPQLVTQIGATAKSAKPGNRTSAAKRSPGRKLY